MKSMTGFAAHDVLDGAVTRSWEMRAVNGRGLDIKLRLSGGAEAHEPTLRKKVGTFAARGNVTVSLKTQQSVAETALSVDEAALQSIIAGMRAVEAEADRQGVSLAPSTPAQVLQVKGVLVSQTPAETQASEATLLAEIATLCDAFDAMRQKEGAAIAEVIAGQIDEIETLTQAALALADTRADAIRASYIAALNRLGDARETMDEARIAQDVAQLLVKADVTEELDRLTAHIAAARALLAAKGPVGRKFDFLTQEFNREANTLCSKSQLTELTEIGLNLKAVIDQLREQVQNVE